MTNDLLLWPRFSYLAQPQLWKAFCAAVVFFHRLPAAILMSTFSRDVVFQSHFDTWTVMLHHWVIRVTCLVVARDDVTTTVLFDFSIRSRDVALMDCFELSMLTKKTIFRDVSDGVVFVADVVVVVGGVAAFPRVPLLDDSVLKLEHV